MLSELALLRARALRKGVWFRTLNRVERSIVELTMRCVNTISSNKLTSTLRKIVEKLKTALESPVRALAQSIGRQLAGLASKLASSWGNPHAHAWARDERFAFFWAICYLNMPDYYKRGWLGVTGLG